MGQDYKNKNITYVLILSFLIGLLWGCMMLTYRQTEQADEIFHLLGERIHLLIPMVSKEIPLWQLFLHLFVSGAAMLLLTYTLGLWLIGQPFLLFLYAAAGVLCGGYGAVLMQNGLTFFLLGYLPYATVGFLIQLPMGVGAMHCSFSAGDRFRRTFVLLLRQLVMLGLVCIAAAMLVLRFCGETV